MPITCKLNKGKKYLYCVVEGKLTLEEFEEYFKDITNSKDHPADIDVLWDITQADLSILKADYQLKMVEIVKKFPQRGEAKRALYSDTDAGFGIARMYKGWSGELSRPMNVFRKLQDAEDWLLNQEEKNKKSDSKKGLK